MGLVVIIVAAFTILGVAALGLVLAQKGGTPTATAASTVRIASATQEVSALPTRAPISQIAQATGSEASPLILRANVDPQSGSPMTTVTQAPSAAAAVPSGMRLEFGGGISGNMRLSFQAARSIG